MLELKVLHQSLKQNAFFLVLTMRQLMTHGFIDFGLGSKFVVICGMAKTQKDFTAIAVVGVVVCLDKAAKPKDTGIFKFGIHFVRVPHFGSFLSLDIQQSSGAATKSGQTKQNKTTV